MGFVNCQRIAQQVGTRGGWSFHCRERGFKVYPTGDDARNATDAQLQTRPVFSTREAPFLSNASQYSDEDYFTLLALHMPALTPAMGRPDGQILNPLLPMTNKDMPSFIGYEGSLFREWGRNHPLYKNRWLHSDVKNMAYFYIHPLFSHMVEILQGGSK